jgi:uncharacterized membrane protein YdjX (TVP38/TMEM64 family)
LVLDRGITCNRRAAPGPRVPPGTRAALFASLFFFVTLAFAVLFATAAIAQETGAETSRATARLAVTSGPAAALPAWARAAIESVRGTPPVVFFSALVVATFLPLPIGVFYLTAGVVYGIAPALAWIAGSLVVSNLILHSLSKGFLRPGLEAFVARRGQRIPRFDSPLDEALFITLIRLTPGLPCFLQNVILAVADLDRMRFVGLSVGIQMLYGTGFVVLGRSIFDGEFVWVAGGAALLVAIAAGARAIARRRDAGSGRSPGSGAR